MHNSNKKFSQIDLFGDVLKEKWHFVGIYPNEDILLVNDIENPNTWTCEITTIPDKREGDNAQIDDKINKSPYSANRGMKVKF